MPQVSARAYEVLIVDIESEVSQPTDLIKIRTVLKIVAMSRSAVYAEMKKGNFPRQVRLTVRSVAWIRGEVQAWVTDRILKSKGPTPLGRVTE